MIANLASGITTTWTGNGATGPGNWTDAANWDNGVPTNNDIAQFDASGLANQPDLGASIQNMQQLQFNTSGWTVTSGAGGGIRFISGNVGIFNNTSSGTNTVSVESMTVNGSGDTMNWSVNSGSTLILNGTTLNRNAGSQLLGGGTIFLNQTDTTTGSTNTSGFSGTLLTGASGIFAAETSDLGGGIYGGVGTFTFDNFGNGTLTGTMAPGGDGVLLPQIGTLFLTSEDGNRSGLILDTGSTLAMDIGAAGPGDNDLIETDFNGGPSFSIGSGVTLALSGTIVQAGTYTLIEDIDNSGNFTGTFGAVTWNGADVTGNPDFQLNYGNDAITITLATIPEPSTYGLLVGLGVMLWVIRRRQN